MSHQPTIYLVRGLPGTGKSTIGALLTPGRSIAADDFFVDAQGAYNFDPRLLPAAHEDCHNRAAASLKEGHDVAVCNTFTARWEMESYLTLAQTLGARVVVVDTYDGGMDDTTLAERNLHGVPAASIATMRRRWEHNWREGNPVPPFLR